MLPPMAKTAIIGFPFVIAKTIESNAQAKTSFDAPAPIIMVPNGDPLIPASSMILANIGNAVMLMADATKRA